MDSKNTSSVSYSACAYNARTIQLALLVVHANITLRLLPLLLIFTVTVLFQYFSSRCTVKRIHAGDIHVQVIISNLNIIAGRSFISELFTADFVGIINDYYLHLSYVLHPRIKHHWKNKSSIIGTC